jgi:phosphonate transport system ATP-binding protein
LAEALVELRGAGRVFPNGVRAVGNLNLLVQPGERIAILGPSGAGKSTLLRMVNGLEPATEGVVEVLGQTLTKSRHREVRRQVGMVFQQFHLIPQLTVLQNVLCGRLGHRGLAASLLMWFPKEDIRMAERAIERVGLSDRIHQKAGRLSGGQMQRVAIARALVQQPRLILADEPVASLDPKIGRDVMRLLRESADEAGAAILMNLHQVELAREFADRIVAMKSGEKVFDGPAADFGGEQEAQLYGESG